MKFVQSYRPWGSLDWALKLSSPRKWYFIGCLGSEERSVEPLLELHRANVLSHVDLVQVKDIEPENEEKEQYEIKKRGQSLTEAKLIFELKTLPLDVRVNCLSWPSAFNYNRKKSVCLDISCLPKKFFFPILKAAFQSKDVEDLIVLYAKPKSYPKHDISSNPDPWKTIDQFGCIDMDVEKDAERHLIINTGFVVGGLVEYIKNPINDLMLDMLVPFPAEPWSSVHRAWNSARMIEEELDSENKSRRLNYHRVAALDSSTAFNTLLRLTQKGKTPAAMAPLGPKPTSLAMCLLASQTDKHPVFYAQPKTYAVNYSEGYETTYAYWIKYIGENFYAL